MKTLTHVLLPLASISGILANPTPQRKLLSGPCGMPLLEALLCVNGAIIGTNEPITDLTCKFTLAARSTGQPDAPYFYSDNADNTVPDGIPVTADEGFGLQSAAATFEIHKEVISISARPGYSFFRSKLSPSSNTLSIFNTENTGVEDGNTEQFTLIYECLQGLPTLVISPGEGRYFATDAAGPRGFYSVLKGKTSEGNIDFKPIEVVVGLPPS